MKDLDAQIAKARTRRRIGYAIFLAGALYLSVPMLIASFGGVASGQIWDPYTGEHLSTAESQARWCYDESSRLLQDAGRRERIQRQWEEPAKQWIAKCSKAHPDLHQVIVATRTDLRQRGKAQK